MKIYTKTGDKGTTALVGGTRVSKSDIKLEAYGTLDELQAHLSHLYDLIATDKRAADALKEQAGQLEGIICDLMTVEAYLASDGSGRKMLPPFSYDKTEALERAIDTMVAQLPQLNSFTLTMGGVSYRATGSTGDGYLFAHRLGHTIVPLRPSLVSLTVSSRELKGVKEQLRNVALTLKVDGREVATQQGEMTIDGTTFEGAIVLRLSRDAVDALTDRRKASLTLSLKPALSTAQIVSRLERETKAAPTMTVEALLRKLTLRSLVGVIAARAGVRPGERASQLDTATKERLAHLFGALEFPLADYGGFAEAVTTAGGVALDEVDEQSMESKLCRGLFITGETLDIDADTGGYNLQLAFSSGHLAGVAAAKTVMKTKKC